MAKTLFEKVWDAHVVREEPGEPALLYVDLHLVHEVTSAQAFEGLRLAGRHVRRPELTVATMDHSVPTTAGPVTDDLARLQLEALRQNCAEFGIELHATGSGSEGIVHVIGPEMGLTQPGLTIVCGDSHTSTHGALGALAFPIGTSEVEHVLATQTLPQPRPRTMLVEFVGSLHPGLTPKDAILGAIGQLGVDGGIGHVVEYTGDCIRSFSMEGRMTVCNMSIEWGARAGLIEPDDTTFAYLEGRPRAPQGADWEAALDRWRALPTDADAATTRITWSTSTRSSRRSPGGRTPAWSSRSRAACPIPSSYDDADDRAAAERALAYMDLRPGTAIEDIRIDRVFLGSCTNSRIEDLRAAAAIVAGKQVAEGVSAIVVPGPPAFASRRRRKASMPIFLAAGFDWRRAGCSMCLGMNPDVLGPGERCASTSNRNFEGRQGKGGRTHLVSPAMAAAAALHGHFVDVRTLDAAEAVIA